jgi:hypothetical protein
VSQISITSSYKINAMNKKLKQKFKALGKMYHQKSNKIVRQKFPKIYPGKL